MTRRDARLLALLTAAPLLLFLYPFLLGRTHVVGDVLYSFHPWLSHAAQELQAGRIPWWNPFSACGEPFLANPQTQVFYPPAALFRIFGFADGWRLSLALHQALLTVGAYLLARRYGGREGAAVAALAAAWGGYAVSLWEFPSATATLPWVFFFLLFCDAGKRRWLAPAGALLLLAGYSQVSLYGFLAGGLLYLGRTVPARRWREAPAAALAVAGAALLALPQLAASWQAAGESLRTAVGSADAAAHRLTPVFLLKLVIPAIHDKIHTPFRPPVFDGAAWPIAWNWANTFALGLWPLALAGMAFFSRRRKDLRPWATPALLGLTLAAAWEPLFSLIRSAVPGFRYMTHFSNATLLLIIPVSVAAAAGAEAARRRPGAARAALALLALVPLGLLLFPGARDAALRGILGGGPLTAPQHAFVRGACGAALAFLAVLIPLAGRRGTAPLLAVTLLLELWVFGRDLHPLFPAEFFRRPAPLAGHIAGTDARFAVDPQAMAHALKPLGGGPPEAALQGLRQILLPNISLPFRVPAAWSYEVFGQRRFAEVRRAIPLENPLVPALDFVGGRFLLAFRPLPAPARLILRRDNALLYENPRALPRMTRVPEARVIPENETRLTWMAGGWAPRDEVILEEERPYAGMEGKADDVTWEDAVPGEVNASGTNGGGWLVYSGVKAAGWEASVNRTPATLYRANHAFMAVALPAGGPWRAEFRYRPRKLYAAAAAMAAAWALLAAFTLMGVKELRTAK